MSFANANEDRLTELEFNKKNEIVDEGMNECRKLLGTAYCS